MKLKSLLVGVFALSQAFCATAESTVGTQNDYPPVIPSLSCSLTSFTAENKDALLPGYFEFLYDFFTSDAAQLFHTGQRWVVNPDELSQFKEKLASLGFSGLSETQALTHVVFAHSDQSILGRFSGDVTAQVSQHAKQIQDFVDDARRPLFQKLLAHLGLDSRNLNAGEELPRYVMRDVSGEVKGLFRLGGLSAGIAQLAFVADDKKMTSENLETLSETIVQVLKAYQMKGAPFFMGNPLEGVEMSFRMERGAVYGQMFANLKAKGLLVSPLGVVEEHGGFKNQFKISLAAVEAKPAE